MRAPRAGQLVDRVAGRADWPGRVTASAAARPGGGLEERSSLRERDRQRPGERVAGADGVHGLDPGAGIGHNPPAAATRQPDDPRVITTATAPIAQQAIGAQPSNPARRRRSAAMPASARASARLGVITRGGREQALGAPTR